MSALPEEVSQCSQLETVDISHNSFISLPNCLLNLPKIIKINAMKNFIAGNFSHISLKDVFLQLRNEFEFPAKTLFTNTL